MWDVPCLARVSADFTCELGLERRIPLRRVTAADSMREALMDRQRFDRIFGQKPDGPLR